MRSFFLLAAALAASPAAAQGPAKPPRLIVAISVDQLSADLFAAYRPHFIGGFKQLAERGVVFANGYQSHAATETCPGHSTLLTGRHPAATGIVANNWIDQGAAREDKNIYCSEDERVAGSTSKAYTVSPEHLRVSTLGDRLKAADPRSRNVAVSGKDRAAVMMGGRAVDQRWYWDGKTWASDRPVTNPPRSVLGVRGFSDQWFGSTQEPLEVPALCQARATPYQVTPTVTVGNGRFARAAGDARAFRTMPQFDSLTLALGMSLIREMKLGQGPATDVISIGLSATDYIGHSFGWGGQEMCLQMLNLDRDLEGFLIQLEQQKVDYALVLSADHGGQDAVERLRTGGDTGAVRADPLLSPAEMGKLMAPQLGLSGAVLRGDGVSGDFWLDRAIPAKDRPRVLAEAVRRYKAHPQVETVFTAAEIGRVPIPSGDPSRWGLLQRVRASFDPARSGDFYVVLKQGVSTVARPGPGYVASHGTVWDYDRRVPILFMAPGVRPATPAAAADTVDILPTVASWIGLKLAPGSVDGVCRSEAASCR
ncbi:putative AlkP superfamily pyrophosphatase or phosphodiesterase [Sphingomonas kaistensis]|uniref:Alkaline phosphatase n=1 Tax=Sphingomonas kaistensis TaxID=298708 RepID=A0A7X5Y6D0_9SPHN|nr:alkaline phosphatase family protein [Sphingomonas kaistensis]NJC06014.1 putative AlkP superfamily pyrophosphatase or phosphodiesterase [Sphingomonas kaistensis]